MTLSLCMIVKNEEQTLDRCLNSCHEVFDEIIIVDTGSTDNTVTIAKKYTNKIYHFKWVDNFSLARNYSFSLATSQYVMWLDADDIINKTELDKLKNLKLKLDSNINTIMLKYAIAFDENNAPTFSYYRERIFKTCDKPKWEDPVHEAIVPYGNILYEDITIEHRKINQSTNPKRNLKIYEALVKNKVDLKPRQLFYYARELYFNSYYKKAIKVFKQFLLTTNGYKENYIEACLNISKCYQLIKDNKNALEWLFKSFYFDLPRAEILCEIGDIYIRELNYQSAIYYYKLALQCQRNLKNGGFVLNDCYDFVPYLQLCVCYYYLGDFELSKQYHILAKQLKPNNPIVIANDKIFNK